MNHQIRFISHKQSSVYLMRIKFSYEVNNVKRDLLIITS